MWSDLALGSSFKVKRWLTGFGELSFRWIQICTVSPMHKSSCFIGEICTQCTHVCDVLSEN